MCLTEASDACNALAASCILGANDGISPICALLICLADNQRGGISAVCSAGAAGNLGDVQRINVDSLAYPLTRLACDKQGRERMGKAGGGLIDGLGSERVRKALEELT